ncbi:MAG: hypothetical protein K0U41_08025 [Gammaproteobacteria bacterium]|nr:hypothetical protein [Gammaproteobacteria bacterium]
MSHPQDTAFKLLVDLPQVMEIVPLLAPHAVTQLSVGTALIVSSIICLIHLKGRSIMAIGLILFSYSLIDSAFNQQWLLSKDMLSMIVFIIAGQFYLIARTGICKCLKRFRKNKPKTCKPKGKRAHKTRVPFLVALVAAITFSVLFSTQVHASTIYTQDKLIQEPTDNDQDTSKDIKTYP